MLPLTGIISTSLVTIYAPTTVSYIKNMKFNNPAGTAWVLELYLYNADIQKSTLVYKYELDAGKMINDDSQYILTPGFSFKAKASVINTSFIINGTET